MTTARLWRSNRPAQRCSLLQVWGDDLLLLRALPDTKLGHPADLPMEALTCRSPHELRLLALVGASILSFSSFLSPYTILYSINDHSPRSLQPVACQNKQCWLGLSTTPGFRINVC